MKTLFTALTLLTVTCAPLAAAEAPSTPEYGVPGGAIVGGLLGGPVGFAAGAALGAYVDHVRGKARQLPGVVEALDRTTAELQSAEARMTSLDTRLAANRDRLSAIEAERTQLLHERALIAGLEFEILYPTDDAGLSADANARIERLAELLRLLPDLEVHIEGHADARGAEQHNLALSSDRAAGVHTALIDAGVDPGRIAAFASGETASIAADGDLDGYALERRVRIQLKGEPAASKVARQD